MVPRIKMQGRQVEVSKNPACPSASRPSRGLSILASPSDRPEFSLFDPDVYLQILECCTFTECLGI